MFDIRWIRDNPDAFDAALKSRGLEPSGDVKFASDLIALDEARRRHITALNDMQARRNAASKEIGAAKKAKDEAKALALMAEVAELKDKIAAGEAEEKRLNAELEAALAVIPNMPREDVPVGKDEHDNKELRKVGTPRAFNFEAKQHFEIGEALGLMDFETAAKVSGARFVFLKGDLARLERAIASFMLDLHTGEFGYTEVSPPLMVRNEVMYGTAQLPKFEEDQFYAARVISEAERRAIADAIVNDYTEDEKIERYGLSKGDFVSPEAMLGVLKNLDAEYARVLSQIPTQAKVWLIPTAEVPLTNLVREKITDEAELPIRVTAYTPCFRAEAGAAGKDTRGMIRQHQFSKVELVSITTPDKSLEEHERMTACAEEVLKRLGLPYRTMLLCTGDMGFASRKTYDIEVWLPGQNAYREISSCSVCGDFQARRMNARYRPAAGKGPEFVHTLNGSGLAVGRTLVAVLENYQQEDGSVVIPDALRPYMGGKDRLQGTGYRGQGA